jgi:hypothetical protein
MERYYCPLAPCLPREMHGEKPNDATIAMSLSFATLDAYYRHIEQGHFTPKANAPLPYMLSGDAMRRHMDEGR